MVEEVNGADVVALCLMAGGAALMVFAPEVFPVGGALVVAAIVVRRWGGTKALAPGKKPR